MAVTIIDVSIILLVAIVTMTGAIKLISAKHAEKLKLLPIRMAITTIAMISPMLAATVRHDGDDDGDDENDVWQ